MKNLKSHFVFTTGEQNGIFLLVFIIIVLQGVYFFWDFEEENHLSTENKEQVQIFQKQFDSLKAVAAAKKKPKIYPFNPNFISDYKGYTLGMSLEEIDKLHAYREQDKWINSAEDFQKVTGISDSLLLILKPYFDFPDFLKKRNKAEEKVNAIVAIAEKRDLNQATAEELLKIRGVGEVLSERIVRYRQKIGGFVHQKQLKDVYGLEYEVIERINAKFTVEPSENFEKLDINKATLLQLSEIIYFDYELAREIIDHRLLHQKIQTFEELIKIPNFPAEKIDRIKLYLTINKDFQ